MTQQHVINTAIIGFGTSGKSLHTPLIEAIDTFNLSAVATLNSSQAASIPDHCKQYSVDEIMAEPNIKLVIIATPNDSHYTLAKRALLANKHVVVEKPVALKSSQAIELAQLSNDKKLTFATFHNRLWDCDFLAIKDLIKNNKLGKVHSYSARVDRFWPDVVDNWRNNSEYGGSIWELAPNLIMQSLQLFGNPQSVFADISTQRSDADAPDNFYIRLSYCNNLCVELRSSSLIKHSGPRFVIHGDKGSYIKQGSDPQHKQLKAGLSPENKKYGQEAIDDWGSLYANPLDKDEEMLSPSPKGDYMAFYQQLYRAITQSGVSPVDGERSIEVVQIVEAALQSHQQQKVINLSQIA